MPSSISLADAPPQTASAAPLRAAPAQRFTVLPGFGLSLGFTIFYLTLIVLIPLSAVFLKTFTLTWDGFWATVSNPRVVASLELSFGASLIAAIVNTAFGLVVAWVLVRYRFFGKRFIDALVDLPFALPTAVAGIALTALFAGNGWIGRWLEPHGIKVAFTPLGVVVALTFIGLPFVVRTVQPVLEDVERELEEAAASLGASRLQTFGRVILPAILPALLTGFAMSFVVRIGGLHLRQHADGVRDCPADDLFEAGTVRLCRRHRGGRGDAGDLVRAAAADQPAAGLDAPPPDRCPRGRAA